MSRGGGGDKNIYIYAYFDKNESCWGLERYKIIKYMHIFGYCYMVEGEGVTINAYFYYLYVSRPMNNTIQYNTIQYNKIQYSTTGPSPVYCIVLWYYIV